MPTPVVEKISCVFVAHGIESHGAVDVRIIAAYDVACRDVDHIFAFIGEDDLAISSFQRQRRPPGKENGALDTLVDCDAMFLQRELFSLTWS